MLLPKPSYPDIHKGRQQTSSMMSIRSGDSGFVSLLQSDAWRTVHEASTRQHSPQCRCAGLQQVLVHVVCAGKRPPGAGSRLR